MTREEEINEATINYVQNEVKDSHFFERIVGYAFKDGAEWADSHPRWISVEEELPKIGKDVLVLREDGEMQVAHQYNESIARWWSVDGYPLKNNITHWMPLPSLPVLSNSSNIGKDLKGGEE